MILASQLPWKYQIIYAIRLESDAVQLKMKQDLQTKHGAQRMIQ